MCVCVSSLHMAILHTAACCPGPFLAAVACLPVLTFMAAAYSLAAMITGNVPGAETDYNQELVGSRCSNPCSLHGPAVSLGAAFDKEEEKHGPILYAPPASQK